MPACTDRLTLFPCVSGLPKFTKMDHVELYLALVIALSSIVNIQAQSEKRAAAPNFVILLADDLGIGDIGCYGNDTIRTPNIDEIAKQGVKLEHNLSPESLCTPSRGAFLTGRYPIRLGLASSAGRKRVFVKTAVQGGLPGNETTFAKVLQRRGYRTGYIGKWHLGLSHNYSDFIHHPLSHGFDFFYGLPLTNMRDCGLDSRTVFAHVVPQLVKLFTGTAWLTLLLATLVIAFMKKLSFLCVLCVAFAFTCVACLGVLINQVFYTTFNCFLMRDFDVVEQPVYLTDLTQRFTTDAVRFIQQNKHEPFLLFLSFAKVHTALFTTNAFANNSKHGKYGDNVEEMDWAVGQIMKAISDNHLKDQTFIYFTSDHGPHLEQVMPTGEYHGGWRGKYRGGKAMSWEGGIRVPTVAMWPGTIPPGTIVSEPTGSIDLFRTIIELANASIPQDRVIDSKNIFSLLLGNKIISPHEFIYHYCANSLQAVTHRPRQGNKVWKAHFTTPKWTPGTTACFIDVGHCLCHGDSINIHNPPLLFSLTNDFEETRPLDPNLPDHKIVIDTIIKAAEKHRGSISKVPDQMDLTYALPWLQMCCNFPWCYCREKYPHQLLSIHDYRKTNE